jgi:DNA-binding NtrC family response regulator
MAMLAYPLLKGAANSKINVYENAISMATSLIFHEDSDCRDLIKRVLIGNGHRVTAFAEESEAIEWAHINPVDLAIISLDSKNSNCSAWLNLKSIQQNLKILVLAKYRTKGQAQAAVAQGADDYLLKPIEIEVLEDKLKNIDSG